MTARARVDAMVGAEAPPRDNGELVFEAPWQARVFAIAVTLVDEQRLDWEEFRQRLIGAIATNPGRPYYESWAAALEDLVVSLGLTTTDAITAVMPHERHPL